MMAEAVGRHFGRLLENHLPLPDLLMVDGGRGQLSATLEQLAGMGCPPLPVLGLAKRLEEIILPGVEAPLRLDRHDPALRMLQALRDEAHRFAITYHRSLRDKRMEQSVLDTIPGIGPARRRAILKAFGSVRKLRKTTADEVAKRVPGIGVTTAEKLLRALRG
jgi:excinuclease ABC subunit C